jgi:hypothetical protein
MKFVMITFHFEFSEEIEAILEKHAVHDFVRYARVEGKDMSGRHYGTKVFPGHSTVVQARIEDDRVEALLDELRHFQQQEESHRHLTTLVMPVEAHL